MLALPQEAGIAPVGAAGAALLKVANVLLVAYTAWEIADYEEESQVEPGDPICTDPLTPYARTVWAEKTANFKAMADARISDPFVAQVAKDRIDELIDAIRNDPAWTICETSAQSKVLVDMIDQLAAMNPQDEPQNGGQNGADNGANNDAQNGGAGNGAQNGRASWVLPAGIVAALLFIWSQS